MRKTTSWRWGFVVWLAAVFMGATIGCHPATTPGTSPTTTKPDKQTNKNDKPVKQPPADPG